MSASAATSADACMENPSRVRIATLNLLNKNAPHGLLFLPWSIRQQLIAEWMKTENIGILATQEGVLPMLKSLSKRLPDFAFEGEARSHAPLVAEYAAIFYDTKRFARLNGGTFWLSETPNKPGKGWDAMNARVSTWLELRDLQSNKTFFVFDGHFDHVGDEARRESAKLILSKIKEIAGSNPVVFLGDLNADESDDSFKTLDSVMSNARVDAQSGALGPDATYLFGWRIDHVLTANVAATCRFEVQTPFKKPTRKTLGSLPCCRRLLAVNIYRKSVRRFASQNQKALADFIEN